MRTANNNDMTVAEIADAKATSSTQANATEIKLAEQNIPALQERLRDLAGNNFELKRMMKDMGVFSDSPMEAMSAIRTLATSQVKTSMGGMEISMTSDETGEVVTQYISSRDGINAQGDINVDYGSLAGAKVLAGQDIETQKFGATLKSIGQDAFNATPAGRSFNAIKRGHFPKRWLFPKTGKSTPNNNNSYDGNYLKARRKVTRNDEEKRDN